MKKTKITINEIISRFNMRQLVEMLPDSITNGNKQFYLSEDVFVLKITREHLFKKWICCYQNDRYITILFETTHADFELCVAKMLHLLSQNEMITIKITADDEEDDGHMGDF